MTAPVLTDDALRAVQHRGSPLQIIACAGSGKTEVVAQRIADLFAEGVAPTAVVAFTFTERAAEELKQRIQLRTQERLGEAFVGRLNGCFVGTIHAYCFRLLQQHVAKYETYDILDEHRLAAFLTRIEKAIELKQLEGQLFASIKAFMRNMDVVDNELIPLERLETPFREVLARFYDELERYRFLTFGQVIGRVVKELADPQVFAAVHVPLRHLVVDEYQDINPAQEALIRRLAAAPVELCVVGDDDQSIYQWRGSDVSNIVTFQQRYPKAVAFRIDINRRSRPAIIKAANNFAETIQGRLTKAMKVHRDAAATEFVCWRDRTEAEEAAQIAELVNGCVARGFRFKDIAVLVRSSSSYAKLLQAFEAAGIPVQPAGRTGLFREPDAQLFGRTFAYLAGHDWRPEAYGGGERVELGGLVEDYGTVFELSPHSLAIVRDRLQAWQQEVAAATRRADLVGDYYDLLADCQVAGWDFSDPLRIGRLGTLARCSAILADYESVRRRARPDPKAVGELVGGQDRGEWYYRWLAIHIQNWALGTFEGFDGEDSLTLDAVDLTTVHQSKGLEWPIVFVPCVSDKRFPSSKTGQAQTWLVPQHLFSKVRYEGTENDERRLFYVAISRARDWLSVSTHDTPASRAVQPSPFIRHLAGGDPPYVRSFGLPQPASGQNAREDLLYLTFSELASYRSCALAYRLRQLIGFQPPLVPELGYGRAVHHVLRHIAEFTRTHDRPPNGIEVGAILDSHFYLPASTKPAHVAMKAAAQRLVSRYISTYGEELHHVWAVERPFELHLNSAVIRGRADVILEQRDGTTSSLAIVDYKTAEANDDTFERQLQVYADAGRREGLDIRAAYVHDLKAGDRVAIDIRPAVIDSAEQELLSLVSRLCARDFSPAPGTACGSCDVKRICRHAS